jgi:hypothetical protein
MMVEIKTREFFEKKALAGDGAFAIAYAILDLSDSQEATAKALFKLGNGNASTDLGAIENLSMTLERVVENLAMQIGGAGECIGSAIINSD